MDPDKTYKSRYTNIRIALKKVTFTIYKVSYSKGVSPDGWTQTSIKCVLMDIDNCTKFIIWNSFIK